MIFINKRTLKILKTIYQKPYITIGDLKEKYKNEKVEEILLFLSSEHIRLTTASCFENDKGYTSLEFNDKIHCICESKGEAEVEKTFFNFKDFFISKGFEILIAIITSVLTCYAMKFLGLLD